MHDALVRFGDMTFEEIRDAAAAGAIAVVPTGCTEQQGPHLAVDNDTWFAEALTNAAADRLAPEITAVQPCCASRSAPSLLRGTPRRDSERQV
jgi:creatinine amidohydrolase/Fe(II)-dependent formamide hydrolase-like protein